MDECRDSLHLEKSFAYLTRGQLEPVLFVTFTSEGANELSAFQRLEHSLGQFLVCRRGLGTESLPLPGKMSNDLRDQQ